MKKIANFIVITIASVALIAALSQIVMTMWCLMTSLVRGEFEAAFWFFIAFGIGFIIMKFVCIPTLEELEEFSYRTKKEEEDKK